MLKLRKHNLLGFSTVRGSTLTGLLRFSNPENAIPRPVLAWDSLSRGA